MKNLTTMLLTFFFVSLFVQAKSQVEYSDSPVHLKKDNFDIYVNHGVTLVDFWATWCKPCKKIAPDIEKLAEVIGNEAHICKLDVDQLREKAKEHKITSIPTVIIFKNGVEVKRFVGIESYQQYLKGVEKALED